MTQPEDHISSGVLAEIFDQQVYILPEDYPTEEQVLAEPAITTESTPSTPKQEQSPPAQQRSENWKLIGNATGKVLFVFSNPLADSLSLDDKQFLAKILKAIKVDFTQIGSINLALNQNLDWDLFWEKVEFQNVILLGHSPYDIGFKDTVVNTYEILEKGQRRILATDSLAQIAQDVNKKRALWTNLQRLFPEAAQ